MKSIRQLETVKQDRIIENIQYLNKSKLRINGESSN